MFTGLVAALGGAATGLILLGSSWLVLLIAGALGVIFTQFAVLGHEASHRQVLTSGPANDRVGRVLATLFVGISYSWWMNKHTRHHATPNKIGKDPDIEIDTVSFHEESAAIRTGLMAWKTAEPTDRRTDQKTQGSDSAAVEAPRSETDRNGSWQRVRPTADGVGPAVGSPTRDVGGGLRR